MEDFDEVLPWDDLLLSWDDLLILENASRGDIGAPEMCSLYADMTPVSFAQRAERLADLGYLDRIISRHQPATYSLADLGRDAVRQGEAVGRAEVIRRTGTW